MSSLPPKLAMVAVISNDMFVRCERSLYRKARECEDEGERKCHVERYCSLIGTGALTRDDIEAGAVWRIAGHGFGIDRFEGLTF